jgi:hypothetical protein
LLPLLERPPGEVVAAVVQAQVLESPLPAMVRFALTSSSNYWRALALVWLEQGFPSIDVLDVLAELKDLRTLPHPLRHRALRLSRRRAPE